MHERSVLIDPEGYISALMVRESPQAESDAELAGPRLTPVMRQYRELKEKFADTVLLFRIGDFYETFEEDAKIISKELEIVLTSRSKIGDNPIPLAGVPYHAIDGYIAKLIGKGYKVAICEQVEDPKTAKGIVKREIVRVITPGTVIDSSMLSSSAATYLMSICPDKKGITWGLALLDISTGEFFVATVELDDHHQNLLSEIARYHPAECIMPSHLPEDLKGRIQERGVLVSRIPDSLFEEDKAGRLLMSHFLVATLAGYGCENEPAAIGAAGAALAYAQETQYSPLPHI
ncbi:MAG: DNA mismatch repair protein MutS, partial [Methanoregula sp.]|nr:DNA mismatch repair protein MutS [Methanoregula sp.]